MITNTLFAIAIPTYNRADLLNPNLIAYTELFPFINIFVVDNGAQRLVKHRNIIVLEQLQNQFVSRSWNILCDAVFGEGIPYCLMLNDDIDFRGNEEKITELIEDNPGIDFFNSFYDWSSFILPEKTYKEIGAFDENMSCYFSDDDYNYRMKEKEADIMMTTLLNPAVFRRSQTIEKDPLLNVRFELDRQAYIKKHGGGVGSEQY